MIFQAWVRVNKQVKIATSVENIWNPKIIKEDLKGDRADKSNCSE